MCDYINGAIIQEDFSMKKTIYDENNGLWYELRGDYYFPCLTVPAQEERPIGNWGQWHLRYIKKERKALYTELLTSGRLNTYLSDINERAEWKMFLLTKQMAEREGVTEQLKPQGQILWVREVGTTDEQHPRQSNGDRKSRSNLRIRYRAAGSNPRVAITISDVLVIHHSYYWDPAIWIY